MKKTSREYEKYVNIYTEATLFAPLAIPKYIANRARNLKRQHTHSIPEELPELRGLLYEDEGIELNPIDEISEDLEPFDFAECELF